MINDVTLDRCPFCNGLAHFCEGFRGAYESRGRIGFIECNDCGAQGEKFSGHDCKEKSIRSWNLRYVGEK